MKPLATALPTTWTDRTERLGAALSSITEGGHQLSLNLAGALLERGVAPEAVPAIVDVAAARAGWRAPAPNHYRRNATDTVHRWANRDPIRTDLPPHLVLLLDELTGQQPQTPVSLPEMQAELARAIREAPDGLSLVRVPCGAGKTHTARMIAAERHVAGLRTTISVPTNELAVQIADDLRAAGVPTARLFGPTSVRGPYHGWACAYRPAAAKLADGWQSVRWELCEGRKRDPCPHRQTCPAADGVDGPSDALVVVGNHGLLAELHRVTGRRGLLVVDEPPEVLDDHVLTDDDLCEAFDQLARFELGDRFAPALAVARSWLRRAPLDEPATLADAEVDCDPALSHGRTLGELLEEAGHEDVVSALEGAIPKHALSPVANRLHLITTREDPTRAGRLGRASRVLTLLHRALTEAGVCTVVFETHRTKERKLAIVGVERQLLGVLNRDGRVVIMAADVHLYRGHFADVVGYEPPITHLSAPDGCQVRRVLLEQRVSRSRKPHQRVLEQALEVAAEGYDAPQIGVVVYMAWKDWAHSVATVWAANRGVPAPSVRYYGALRGLDTWKRYDALVTLGDPLPNLNAVARTTEEDVSARANDLARAELEQAHGRLRVIHRGRPATQVHVGRQVPFGWPAPHGTSRGKRGVGGPTMGLEVHGTPRGRPRREGTDLLAFAQIVRTLGGVRATARRADVAHTTVRRWLRGEAAPPPKVVASLRDAAQGGKTPKRAK